jgi:hypothetical protein
MQRKQIQAALDFRHLRKERVHVFGADRSAADGTPIMLTDSREAAIATAMSQQLEIVGVH